MQNKPLLIMFLGYPGSGKSTFARQLADKLNVVRLNGDSMRIALFKTIEGIEAQPDKKVLNEQTFGAIDYAASQILKSGHTFVYDANNNKRSIREGLCELATECGARPVVVWVRTPYDVALQRGQTREAATDTRNMTEEKMLAAMTRQIAAFDEPGADEFVIEIPGTIPFEEQFSIFEERLQG